MIFVFVLNQKEKEKGEVEQNQRAWWQPAVLIFLRMSAWIAVPVIAAVFLGKWLDEKYQSEPWLFLISVGIAFLVSMFGLVKSAAREYKKIEREEVRSNLPAGREVRKDPLIDQKIVIHNK